VLRLLAQGQTSKQAALHLNISTATIDDHRTAIQRQCAAAWNGPQAEFNTAFLRQQFGPFLAGQEIV
jgi:hypothetical protein